LSDYEITHVIHLAANAIVRICAQDPINAYESNVMGTVKLLEAIRQVNMNNIKSIVISTSDKAYGHAEPPYKEDTPFKPLYTYEATKACQDFVAQNYYHNYNLPIRIVRCSNIYGPADPNWSRLIPNTIKRVLNNESPQIYTSVMNYIREWVYVDDVIEAFELVLHKGNNGEAYCIGGTETASVTDVVNTILQLCNSEKQIMFLDKIAQFKEIENQWIDGTKLKTLGWSPKHSLSEGLAKTISYYKNLQC
jgi:dTDP-glucose 4,6-dehydratase